MIHHVFQHWKKGKKEAKSQRKEQADQERQKAVKGRMQKITRTQWLGGDSKKLKEWKKREERQGQLEGIANVLDQYTIVRRMSDQDTGV